MRFDRKVLRQRIPPTQVKKDLAVPSVYVSGGLAATPLDPLFTVTDDEFLRRLDANATLPPEIRGIRDFYRTP
jgi:hypothetical protein